MCVCVRYISGMSADAQRVLILMNNIKQKICKKLEAIHLEGRM